MKTKNSLYILLIGMGMLMLANCAGMRMGLVEMSNEDVKNAEAVREAADNFMSTWELNSAFIRKALGTRIDQFPKQFHEAMDELDEFTGEPIADRTDTDRGGFLGLRVRTLESIIQECLKIYALDLLELIPFPLKF